MKAFYKRKRLAIVTAAYWFLLAYIIAALIWWYIALLQQNQLMTEQRILLLSPDMPDYQELKNTILDTQKRKFNQYAGEGLTFLFIIILGAVYVYQAVRRQFLLTQQQQNFMMAVTHELKTPIAVTKLNLETLKKHKLDENRQQALLDISLQETNRLTDLCNNILLASQFDSGGYSRTYEETDLSDLLARCVQNFQIKFPNRNIQQETEGQALIYGDPLLLELAFNNVLENAIKYSPTNTKIIAQLDTQAKYSRIRISDEGPGIQEEEKKKIFHKFYRIGSENTRNTQGTGLGLYLTQKIIEGHGGEIEVKNNKPNGSIFVIRLPQ